MIRSIYNLYHLIPFSVAPVFTASQKVSIKQICFIHCLTLIIVECIHAKPIHSEDHFYVETCIQGE